jgi:hypothetical protein
MAELNADLLGGFPNRGRQKIRIRGFAPATREGHVSGPRIAGPLGSSDEEDGVRIGGENDGYRGPNQRWVVVCDGGARSQSLAQTSQPAGQCERDWQPPR